MIRLSLDEVQKVLRLAASKGVISPTAGPTVNSVADAFGLQPMQVERLLSEVREREAEAPQWRKLRAVAAAAGALALLCLSFTAWQAWSGRSAPATGVPTASANGLSGPNSPSSYMGTPFAQSPSASSPESVAMAQTTADVGRPSRYRTMSESGEGGPVLPQNRYAKTDATDLTNARAKADRYGNGIPGHGQGGLPTGIHATNVR